MIQASTNGEGGWTVNSDKRISWGEVRVKTDKPGRIVTRYLESSGPAPVVLRVTSPAGVGDLLTMTLDVGEEAPLVPSDGDYVVRPVSCLWYPGCGTDEADVSALYPYGINNDARYAIAFVPGTTDVTRWRSSKYIVFPPDEASTVSVVPPPCARRFRFHVSPAYRSMGDMWVGHGTSVIYGDDWEISRRDVGAAFNGRWIEEPRGFSIVAPKSGAPVPHDTTALLRIEWECEL